MIIHCILTVFLLLGLCLPLLPTPIYAQVNEPSLNSPAATMKQESQVQDQTYEKSEWVFPNSGWQKSIRNDLVFLTFPQDDALFLLDSVITLGWQPVLEPSLPISYYEIVITRTNSDQNTVAKTGMVDENMVSTYLFTSLQAGRYFWTVRAVTENGKTIPGEGRYLNVIE